MKPLLLLSIVLCFWACRDETPQKPSPFLDETTMVKLMIELQLADAQVSQLHISSTDSAVLVYQHLETNIFKKNKIDSTVYRRNYRYYIKDLKKFRQLTQAVMDSLQKRETEAAKIITTPTSRPMP